ncbi:Protein kinase domain-containing protein [Mycena indigotica]|uniref:Protein kinase domain-containing protein n=1 Tax=Mycena indigotica TaxID=2126181 RepID=A0A8H6WBL6_9AGAR|nr:Protein kinase domain-containing protein [Mycena indigotica]KAF7312749.1 Protein kinase domain-containing protein [Mycena indigotica]
MSCSSQTLPDLTGAIIDGDLELLTLLGEGSYGKVYQAQFTTIPNHYLAVKCMPRCRRRSQHARLQSKELRNHKAVSKHPGVVTLYREIVTDEFVFVVLDCADTDLFKVMASGLVFTNRPQLIKEAINSILDALSYMHRKGVYHRDLKPENLLCDRNGKNIRIADFGLSTQRSYSNRHWCGSLPYMSPETLDSRHPSASSGYSTKSSDLWAVAIMLCAFVSGGLPWGRPHASDGAYAAFLKNDDYLMSRLHITQETNDLLKRCFHTKRRHRPTLEEFRDAVNSIDRFSTSDPVVVSRTPVTPVAKPTSPSAEPSPKKTTRSRRSSLDSLARTIGLKR